jgi:hypothetical protein
MNNRHASDIISHQNPLMLPPTATVKQACQRMRDRRVGAVLVTDVEKPTRRDRCTSHRI